jgi:hypothetical protein
VPVVPPLVGAFCLVPRRVRWQCGLSEHHVRVAFVRAVAIRGLGINPESASAASVLAFAGSAARFLRCRPWGHHGFRPLGAAKLLSHYGCYPFRCCFAGSSRPRTGLEDFAVSPDRRAFDRATQCLYARPLYILVKHEYQGDRWKEVEPEGCGGNRRVQRAGPACLGEQFFDRFGRQHALAQFFELHGRACGEPFLNPLWHGAEPLLDQAP